MQHNRSCNTSKLLILWVHIEGELALLVRQLGFPRAVGRGRGSRRGEAFEAEGRKHAIARRHGGMSGAFEDLQVSWFWLECRVETEEWWEMRKRGNAEKAEARSFVLSCSRCLWNVYCVPSNELLDTGLLPLHYLSPVSFSGSFTWVHLLNITEPQDTATLFSTYIFSLAISFSPLYLNTHYT